MRYLVSEHVDSRLVQDEMIILDAHASQYLGLNGTAAVVWTILASGGSVAAAVDDLVARFDVPRKTAEADVARLLEDLLRLGLITRTAP